MKRIRTSLKRYWPLIKSLQTGLLLFTGLAGYMTARCPVLNWTTMIGLAGSLFLAISGSTVMNMVYDRDIDAKMKRTCLRPLPVGSVSTHEGLVLGSSLSLAGIIWATGMNGLFGLVVFAGWFFDVVIYTMLLKRRTAWSIVWGGIAGGMPVLAGRTLGLGTIDWVGISLTFAVLFWIPTHILTFSLRYKDDYARAAIPTFPSRYGDQITQRVIALSSLLAAVAIGLSAIGIGITWGYLRLLCVLSAGLLVLALFSLLRPSSKLQFRLFKYASLYMLGSMLLLSVEAF
ncbi:MAG: heme o synthase [Anaerolineales bacterium]|jgi:protoheme IX farnesyltransferase